MRSFRTTLRLALPIASALALALPAHADVKDGVDAWQAGDFAKAVAEWRPLALAGDADAQFNLGQAYKLGRGVPVDLVQAESWYRRAAKQGHLQAEDNLGLVIFTAGRQKEAMPYIIRSAERGEPRAQYVLGTALFNGDLIAKDWPRSYALTKRASDAGARRGARTDDSYRQPAGLRTGRQLCAATAPRTAAIRREPGQGAGCRHRRKRSDRRCSRRDRRRQTGDELCCAAAGGPAAGNPGRGSGAQAYPRRTGGDARCRAQARAGARRSLRALARATRRLCGRWQCEEIVGDAGAQISRRRGPDPRLCQGGVGHAPSRHRLYDSRRRPGLLRYAPEERTGLPRRRQIAVGAAGPLRVTSTRFRAAA